MFEATPTKMSFDYTTMKKKTSRALPFTYYYKLTVGFKMRQYDVDVFLPSRYDIKREVVRQKKRDALRT